MKQHKVLIVDDEPLTCQLLAKMLSLQGYQPLILTDYTKVMTEVETKKPDLILMDYYLGSGLGLEVLQSLKAQPWSQNIPVIIASGINRRAETLDAGAADFILKPFNWNDLAKTIKSILNP